MGPQRLPEPFLNFRHKYIQNESDWSQVNELRNVLGKVLIFWKEKYDNWFQMPHWILHNQRYVTQSVITTFFLFVNLFKCSPSFFFCCCNREIWNWWSFYFLAHNTLFETKNEWQKTKLVPIDISKRNLGPVHMQRRKKIISCFDIGEVPRSPGKWNWNRLSFLPFIFSFKQCV